MPNTHSCGALYVSEGGRDIDLNRDENRKIREIPLSQALSMFYVCRQIHDQASGLAFKENNVQYRINVLKPPWKQCILRRNRTKIKPFRLTTGIERREDKEAPPRSARLADRHQNRQSYPGILLSRRPPDATQMRYTLPSPCRKS